jgi:amidohydrolase
MALGAADLLSRQDFQGTVRFIFQPSEEASDSDGMSGAGRMVQAGVMGGVQAVIALHVDASLARGDIALDAGPSSAGVDTLYVTIIGQGGHGATPQKVIDPIYIASHVILALHGIVSRRLHPYEPAVLSIGSIHGGEAHNVIPEQVEITGTIRYMANLAPGAMFYLGCRIDGDERKHHHPRFDIDESCLPLGTAVLTETALRLLEASKGLAFPR